MTDDKSYIDSARRSLVQTGSSEVGLREELDGIDELWREIQKVKKEMHTAKRAAAEEAAIPYLERLKDLEDQYALAIKLSS